SLRQSPVFLLQRAHVRFAFLVSVTLQPPQAVEQIPARRRDDTNQTRDGKNDCAYSIHHDSYCPSCGPCRILRLARRGGGPSAAGAGCYHARSAWTMSRKASPSPAHVISVNVSPGVGCSHD